MSRHLSVEQISNLISQLPITKFGKIDWRKSPKQVARIVKALINSKEGTGVLVSKASGVNKQTIYAIMRGKTPDGGKEWPELREALSKMKCEWRGKDSPSFALLPVTSESLTKVFSFPEVPGTNPKVVKKRKTKTSESVAEQVVSGKETSKVETKYFDLESKELVVVVTTRYALKDWQKVITGLAAPGDAIDFRYKTK
jgi:hypothetical protein